MLSSPPEPSRGRAVRRTLTWLPLTALAAVIVALATLSCSTALPPSLEPVTEGLAATRAAAVTADREDVDRFLALFRNFEAEALAAGAAGIYAEDVVFNDGFVALEGLAAVTDYLARSAGHVDGLSVELLDVAFSGVEVYVVWEMAYTTHDGPSLVAPGISHLRFDDGGRIVYHRDYWDASGALAVHVAPVAGLLNAIRNRL